VTIFALVLNAVTSFTSCFFQVRHLAEDVEKVWST